MYTRIQIINFIYIEYIPLISNIHITDSKATSSNASVFYKSQKTFNVKDIQLIQNKILTKSKLETIWITMHKQIEIDKIKSYNMMKKK